MRNNFSNDYTLRNELIAKLEEAEKSNDADRMNAVKNEMKKWVESMNEKGSSYARIYEYYQASRDKGNLNIDFNNTWGFDDEAELVKELRNLGVKQFTFSDRNTRAIEIAYAFQQAGCKLEGIIEIRNREYHLPGEEISTVPAMLFTVQ